MKERKFTISFVNIRCSGIGEQLRSMVHYSPFVNNVAQGLSQDLDSRVSKMDFGGDRVSW